ncbi:hypothetical protein A8B75_11650 [Sphingomonadales bacterium EhC05]|nr:hypothetical protein A8B75_11650 [Sphingomonadales bacterium EhC05]
MEQTNSVRLKPRDFQNGARFSALAYASGIFIKGQTGAALAAVIKGNDIARRAFEVDVSGRRLTPADAYFGRAIAIIKQRERIKKQTIEHRRLQHRKLAA